jgi:CheY-like chemotaxis protein
MMAHVLLLEDDQSMREMLVKMLTQDQHRVTAAADGGEGLQLLEDVKPDLIITDILMPAVDGIEVILKLAERGSTVPIIAISGGRRSVSAEFNLESAEMAGVRVTLSKPFSRDALRSAVQKALA